MEDQSSRSDQNEHHLTLACLPYDIVRKIIQIEGVSMGQMALISRSWNVLVAEHLQNREKYPEMDACFIKVTQNDRIDLKIDVRTDNSKFFEKWENRWTLISHAKEGIVRFSIAWDLEGEEVREAIDRERIAFQICRYLMRFRRISFLKLDKNCAVTRRIILKALGKHIRVEEVRLTVIDFDYFQRNFALELARRFPLNRLDLSADYNSCKIQHLREFLLNIAKGVSIFWFYEGDCDVALPPGLMFHQTYSFWKSLANEIMATGTKDVQFHRGDRCVAWARPCVVQ